MTEVQLPVKPPEQKIYTRCNDCIFAQYTDGKQTGCDVGRLSAFQALSPDLVEWNESTQSFVIQRMCNMKRLQKWASRQTGDKAEIAKGEIAITVDMIVIVDNTPKYKEAAAATCRSLKAIACQSMKPASVIIITSNKDVDDNMKEFWEMVVETLKDKNIKYRLVRLMSFDRSVGYMIDQGLSKCSAQYYAVVSAGQQIATDVIERVNNMINEKMYRFLLIEPTHLTATYPMIVQRVVHNILEGNLDAGIADKIKEQLDKQDKKYLARVWEL